ncbi:sigma-70 family RNA polymerase sigma factor [Echinimonas agarilytica]|uniref:Sigma-70 family RNA polymerase sigma factor n=1 Tax=Echinimonas agarilytica TaxID=1215918 RepID=A0AA41W5Y4_9GAMM|nr:sigma-70 family RNA polymerase sigma factor [Echinimonas agarilytica]MCM2679217.1 sigma-70 family RNA polymerase sigma factor [Echinimonas agarilytica]
MNTKQNRYEALVKAFHKDMYRYAYWLCQDSTVSKDLVQETFLRAWKSLDSLKDSKAAKSWLITILRRENARRFERKQFDLVDMDDVTLSDTATLSAEAEMEQQLIRRQMQMLAPEYREPLMMQIIGGYTGEEIAAELGLNKNTVMTRLFRARNQLKEALEGQISNRRHSNG